LSAEQYYDEQIAPKLIALAEECKEHGLSFLAACEWAPGEYGSTRKLQEGSSFAMRLVEAAVNAQGNIDSLMIAVERHALKHGHSSIYLSLRGVPTQPTGDGQ